MTQQPEWNGPNQRDYTCDLGFSWGFLLLIASSPGSGPTWPAPVCAWCLRLPAWTGTPWTLIHVLSSRHTVSAPVCSARAWPRCFLANPSLTMHIPSGTTLQPHNNSCHVLSTYYVPDDVLSAFHVIIHLILRIIFFEISYNIISIVQILKRRSKRWTTSHLGIQEVTKPVNGEGGFESKLRDNPWPCTTLPQPAVVDSRLVEAKIMTSSLDFGGKLTLMGKDWTV